MKNLGTRIIEAYLALESSGKGRELRALVQIDRGDLYFSLEFWEKYYYGNGNGRKTPEDGQRITAYRDYLSDLEMALN